MILTVRSKRATERKFQGAKWPGNERARERVGQGANRPESYWPIRPGERIGQGAKRLGTVKCGIIGTNFGLVPPPQKKTWNRFSFDKKHDSVRNFRILHSLITTDQDIKIIYVAILLAAVLS